MSPPIPVSSGDIIDMSSSGSGIAIQLFYIPFRAGSGSGTGGYEPDNTTIGLNVSEELYVKDYVSKTYVDNEINTEKNARILADGNLNTKIENETANREQAVNNLQTNINAKANASEVVLLAGTQTITGNKTFSISPTVPSKNNEITSAVVNNAPTTSATLPTSFCEYRNTNDTIHNYVHLRIRQGSSNVNVANKTWAGHTFASVTLIDEFGNAA